jgi:hypothetical protein
MHTINQSDQEIERIMRTIKCPFDFECYQSKFEDMCGSLLEESGKLVGCNDEKTAECNFSIRFGSEFLCACPLRLYISRTYKK